MSESVLAQQASFESRLLQVSAREQPRLRSGWQRLLQRAQRGLPHDRDRLSFEASLQRAEAAVAARAARVPACHYDDSLPVVQRRDDLLAAIRDHQVVVIAGETGSGKTTQIPKLCLELGRGLRGLIGHTQPRRLAATSVARRIAQELGVALGDRVGYNIRFDQKTDEDSLIEVMTDGVLLQTLRRDPLLRRYDTLIIDEAHERSINIDLLLGWIKRILPERPDLKIIITSATIDPEKFSRFFGDAPMLSVSGRTFPVETRYQPLLVEDEEAFERSVPEAVRAAAEELWRSGPGDVLVFLSGEGEIRDVAQYLRKHPLKHAEVMPLYARLSAQEQNKVFLPSNGFRLVLATNVAETSLTVPGIRYVIDSGTARISRYSQASRVQRLPIEPVSQASADQRKGRCGRVASGICVRLFSEEDFASRPAFTTPEIQRTNLASLILQMLSLGMKDVEDFPFLDAPDQKRINDGLRLLQELQAVDAERGLTDIGKRMAEQPLPPQLSRILVAAARERCLKEALVIASFLCIRDPRERPMEKAEAASALHKRFQEAGSDFLGILKLWEHVHVRKETLSNNAWRKEMKAEFLNSLAVVEWGRLYAQLKQICHEQGMSLNERAADALSLHRALLTGFIHQIGQRSREGDWQGARNIRFVAHSGSVLHKQTSPWVMAADFLDGAARLYGLHLAGVEVRDVERVAGDLLKRSYSDPHWRRDRGDAAIKEQITLFGLVIAAARPLALANIDAEKARRMFVEHALVQFDTDEKLEWLQHNKRVIAQVQDLEARQRRRDLLLNESALADWYAARLPAQVLDMASLLRALKAEPALGKRLRMQEADVTAALADREGGWPSEWQHGDHRLRLRYQFSPGDEADGVTVEVPLALLPGLHAEDFYWLVPGYLENRVEALLRDLPKEQRKQLHPIHEYAAQISATLVWRQGEFFPALEQALYDCARVRIRAAELQALRVPDHLSMRFVVLDERKKRLATGRDLPALQRELARQHRDTVAARLKDYEQDVLAAWPEAPLPERVSLATGEAFLALVWRAQTVGVRGFVREAEARWHHRMGVAELLRRALEPDLKSFCKQNREVQQMQLAASSLIQTPVLLADWGRAVAEAALPADVWAVRDAEAGKALVLAVQKNARVLLADSLPQLKAIWLAAAEVRQGLKRLEALPALRDDMASLLSAWLAPGCLSREGVARFRHLRRYAESLKVRGERAASHGGAELARLPAWQKWRMAVEVAHTGAEIWTERGERERALQRMLCEFHVSSFAQSLGTDGPVSEKRIEKLLQELG